MQQRLLVFYCYLYKTKTNGEPVKNGRFKSTSSVVTPEKIVRPFIDSIFTDVIKSVQRKKHDGNKVTDKTISNWKLSFLWLKIETEGNACVRN